MNTSNISKLVREVSELGFADAPAFLRHLSSDPVFLGRHILPILGQARPAREPYIAATFGARESANCLQIFVWPAGAMTAIHDHTAWGAYHCVVGSLLEERYARLDDGEQPNTAHLRKLWQQQLRRIDGVSTVGAYAEGIHRVANQGRQVAISMHLYGPRQGMFDGRDYDPLRDFVCDRLEVDDLSGIRPYFGAD